MSLHPGTMVPTKTVMRLAQVSPSSPTVLDTSNPTDSIPYHHLLLLHFLLFPRGSGKREDLLLAARELLVSRSIHLHPPPQKKNFFQLSPITSYPLLLPWPASRQTRHTLLWTAITYCMQLHSLLRLPVQPSETTSQVLGKAYITSGIL